MLYVTVFKGMASEHMGVRSQQHCENLLGWLTFRKGGWRQNMQHIFQWSNLHWQNRYASPCGLLPQIPTICAALSAFQLSQVILCNPAMKVAVEQSGSQQQLCYEDTFVCNPWTRLSVRQERSLLSLLKGTRLLHLPEKTSAILQP